jgi:hypothetical protein
MNMHISVLLQILIPNVGLFSNSLLFKQNVIGGINMAKDELNRYGAFYEGIVS